MIFTAIFLSLFVLAWLICGFLPWLTISVATRGNAGMSNLPLALFGGLVGGLATPLLIRDDAFGIILSMVLAAGTSSGLLAARRFAAPAIHLRDEASRHEKPHSRERGK